MYGCRGNDGAAAARRLKAGRQTTRLYTIDSQIALAPVLWIIGPEMYTFRYEFGSGRQYQ